MDSGRPYTPDDWTPEFLDYLALAVTTATTFSAADTVPISREAKGADERASSDLVGHNRPDHLPRSRHPELTIKPAIPRHAGRLTRSVPDSAGNLWLWASRFVDGRVVEHLAI